MTTTVFNRLAQLLICLFFATGCTRKNTVALTDPAAEQSCSFQRAPFIHPRIVEDMSCWLSDTGDQVVAVNITDSQDSNRYFGDVKIHDRENSAFPFVYTEMRSSEDAAVSLFGYFYVGTTASGIDVLRTTMNGGGSGSFISLMFMSIEGGRGLSYAWNDEKVVAGGDRVVLYKVGEIPLGDRWDGELRVEGDRVYVGKDRGWFAKQQPSNQARYITILADGRTIRK